MIAELPDGTVQTVAQGLAPYLAAYVQARLSGRRAASCPGIHAVSDQLATFARQLDTIEAIRITVDRNAVVVLTGLRFGKLDVPLATGGISEPAVGARMTFTDGALAIEDHRLALPYSRLVRLALDRGIIPSVDPAAYDLPTLLPISSTAITSARSSRRTPAPASARSTRWRARPRCEPWPRSGTSTSTRSTA